MNTWTLWGCMFIVWIYVLHVLKKEKLTAYFFFVGAAGFFTFVFTMLKDYLVMICVYVLESLLEIGSRILPFYTMYRQYNIMFINHESTAISLFIDYECCGFIEILVAISIIIFFPLFDKTHKFLYCVIGYVYTMLANLIRLIFISAVIYKYGNNAYYIAHSVVGRIVFYVFTLLFYFYMISWKQIKKQRVGRFIYDDETRVKKEEKK